MLRTSAMLVLVMEAASAFNVGAPALRRAAPAAAPAAPRMLADPAVADAVLTLIAKKDPVMDVLETVWSTLPLVLPVLVLGFIANEQFGDKLEEDPSEVIGYLSKPIVIIAIITTSTYWVPICIALAAGQKLQGKG